MTICISVGQVFGRLTAIAPIRVSGARHAMWRFNCECGNIKDTRVARVTSGKVVSCGCFRLERSAAGSKARSGISIGDKFNRLTAVAEANRGWQWRCDCGNIVALSASSVRRGHNKSCGCLADESRKIVNVTHGHTCNGTIPKAYSTWQSMKQRCLNPKHDAFPSYGGRGIKVCKRWLNSFDNFLADMGHPPSDDHSIDRKNANGNYCKSNCRWSTKAVQANNTRANIMLTRDGKTLSVAAWAAIVGIKPATIYARIHSGMDAHKALTKAVR